MLNKRKRIPFPTKSKKYLFPTGKCATRSETSVEKTARVFIAWISAWFIHPIARLNVAVVIEQISIIMYAPSRGDSISSLSIASNLSCIQIQWITKFPFFDNI